VWFVRVLFRWKGVQAMVGKMIAVEVWHWMIKGLSRRHLVHRVYFVKKCTVEEKVRRLNRNYKYCGGVLCYRVIEPVRLW